MLSELMSGVSCWNTSLRMEMCEFVSVRVDLIDTASPSSWMMSGLFPLKENYRTPHSPSFSWMMSEMNEKSSMSPGALYSRR